MAACRTGSVVTFQSSEETERGCAHGPVTIFRTDEDFVINAKIHRRVSTQVAGVVSRILYPVKASWLE
ncbi:MAG: hypothetical protein B9S33_07395 [Pedosphaera sp. Tous-C6FEB]|nr:MAG: hypothetical protein B9S33_07395 [Pedosphaera sp. Tous-C6FEB]